ELPDGLVANPTAAELCQQKEFNGEGRRPAITCPAASQIALVELTSAKLPPFISPLYDLQPSPGVPAEFGFILAGSAIHVLGGVNRSFHLTARSKELLTKFAIPSLRVGLWGNPSDDRWDPFRVGGG